jgi:putative peptidoglycan lipid II flippase
MNLFRALLTVSGFTLLSRVTGLARETLIARAFGASQYTDAFYVAFRIPNLLRRISAEGAFSQAFVPILAEFKNQQGHDATKALVDATSTVLAWWWERRAWCLSSRQGLRMKARPMRSRSR